MKNQDFGFTLAELLIALAILGVIATFAIPKLLDSSQSNEHNAIVKEAVATVSGAYQTYKLSNTASASTEFEDLTPYINYVAVDTATTIDDNPGQGTNDCSANLCLRLHNGAIILTLPNTSFSGTATNNALWFDVDPDGRATPGAGDEGKAVHFALYFNGRITSGDHVLMNTVSSTYTFDPGDEPDPGWFSWN